LPLVVQRAWLRRLSDERRAQAWNGASWAGCALRLRTSQHARLLLGHAQTPWRRYARCSPSPWDSPPRALVLGCIALVDLGLEALLGDASDPYGR
jgi:hypothetical protein